MLKLEAKHDGVANLVLVIRNEPREFEQREVICDAF